MSRCSAGRHFGSARDGRASAPNPQIPWFLARRAGVFATGTCELDRKSKIPAYAAAEDRRNWRMHKTDSSKNIFRVGAAHLKEPASVESAVLTNGSSVGSDFLLNGLPRWINVSGEARHANLIKPVVNIARRHQIPHRRF